MSIRLIFAAAATLALAGPALAQQASAPPAAAQAPSPAAAALDAKAEVFSGHMQTMAGEMQTAITAAGGDQAKANADLDVIVARYQPEADAFSAEVQAFIDSPPADMPAEALAGMAQAVSVIKGVPAMVRGRMQQAAAAAPAPTAAQ